MKITNKEQEETLYIYLSSCDEIVIKYYPTYGEPRAIQLELEHVEQFLEKFNAVVEKLKKKIAICKELSGDEDK